MGKINFLLDRFQSCSNVRAIIFRNIEYSYGDLLEQVWRQLKWLQINGVRAGDPIILYGDYSPLSVSMLLALIELDCIVIPLTPEAFEMLEDSLLDVAPKYICDVTATQPVLKICPDIPCPVLYGLLVERLSPGLVLFTSGSSGKPKAVVHDFGKLLQKFHIKRPAMTTINFLLFDHWGGLNTLLHCLSNLCLIVIPEKRVPEYICELIEKYGIELLPVTPSFLNMLLLSKSFMGKNLSSLKLITYGAEPMSSASLLQLNKLFPKIELRQTYGMIELGVLRAKSRSTDSLWVKLGGEGYDTRVVDGMLQIRADSAMLGYINAPSPFTDDGYLITGDLVETDGEWIKILGRQSDLINVGGQKVYPLEVEATILDFPEVEDVMVYGEKNLIMGKIVCARIVLKEPANIRDSRISILKLCRERLQPYMVPVKIEFVPFIEQSHRLKRKRI